VNLLAKVYSFCRTTAKYKGPQLSESVETIYRLWHDEIVTPENTQRMLSRAFEQGYKRGYADCSDYIAEWIEDEDEETSDY
jgi:hypothetical protein